MKPLALCLALGLALLAGCGEDERAAPTTPATAAAPTTPETGAPTGTEAPTATDAVPPGTGGATGPTTPVEPGAPAEPPPRASEASAPPPAWFESSTGKVWLAYSSYCWATLCVDYVQASCDDASTPTAQATQGETARFHLGFRPAEVTLAVEGQRPQALPARRTIPWGADASGLMQLFVRADGGDVTYTACLTIVGA